VIGVTGDLVGFVTTKPVLGNAASLERQGMVTIAVAFPSWTFVSFVAGKSDYHQGHEGAQRRPGHRRKREIVTVLLNSHVTKCRLSADEVAS
jgi:hypothetical protein